MIDFILHIDTHMADIVANYGYLVYAILFLIIFCETGLVVVPFLPGDSLLFVAGALSGNDTLNIAAVLLICISAAILGDALNYRIGAYFGPKFKKVKSSKYIDEEDIEQSQDFFKKHGAKTIIIARFVPVVRRFAPFLAGSSRMEYPRFLFYNVVGAILWVVAFVVTGYFFGNIPFVEDKIILISIGLLVISLVVVLIIWLYNKINDNKKE